MLGGCAAPTTVGEATPAPSERVLAYPSTHACQLDHPVPRPAAGQVPRLSFGSGDHRPGAEPRPHACVCAMEAQLIVAHERDGQ
jgi:hypothetical protein